MPSIPPSPTDEPKLLSKNSVSEHRQGSEADLYAEVSQDDPDAPVSFVPHMPIEATVPPRLPRFRTGRYGDLDEHELVRLLDSIEDERARARFRESVYLSIFVWIAIALVAFFGPKYLWHAPRVVLPSEVLRQRELLSLTAPVLTPPRLRSTPPAVDNRTLEHLRSLQPKPAPVAPRAAEPPPPVSERAPSRPLPNATAPNLAPSTASPNLPPTPVPQPAPAPSRLAPPVVAEAPRPQPSSRPDFSQTSRSAGDAIQDAVRNAPRGGGGSDADAGVASHTRGGTDLGMGLPEILSDTQGVNFRPYLQRIMREIYDQWIPLIPEEARPPLSKSGTTTIRLTIMPDGSIAVNGMHLDGSTHDEALNRAAWGSITGVGQFPPLPSQFHGPNLELRFHYLVNTRTE